MAPPAPGLFESDNPQRHLAVATLFATVRPIRACAQLSVMAVCGRATLMAIWLAVGKLNDRRISRRVVMPFTFHIVMARIKRTIKAGERNPWR